MSRLDSFIRRMCAQRDILNALASQLHTVEGTVLEFGLGNGRTLDHLRTCFPTRRIIVFEREVRAGCLPPGARAEVMVGDIRDTAGLLGDGSAALLHADIDTGHSDNDAELSTWLPDLVARLLTPGGIAASSFPLSHPCLQPLALPVSVDHDRYFLARRSTAS